MGSLALAGSTAPSARADALTAACPGAYATPAAAGVAAMRGTVACLLRYERTRLHAGGVRQDARLIRAGGQHVQRMVRQRFFSHDGPDGTLDARLEAVRFIPRSGSWSAGEILGTKAGRHATSWSLVSGWLGSAEHRAILSDPRFDRMGVGLSAGTPSGASGITASVEFGYRR